MMEYLGDTVLVKTIFINQKVHNALMEGQQK